MSQEFDPNHKEEPIKPDYTLPIARSGEQQFGAIVRNRSGMDAGELDYGARDITHLHPSEQQDAVNAAYCLYQSFCNQTGLSWKPVGS